MSRDLGTVEVDEGCLLFSNKRVGNEELCWQFGSTSTLACSSQYVLVEKDSNLQSTDEPTRKNRGCGRQADLELEWQWIVHDEGSRKCGLLSCEEELNDSSIALHDAAVQEIRSTDSRSSQLVSSEPLAANCAVEGFNQWHVHERSHLHSVDSQNNGQHTTPPLSSQGASLTASASGRDHQQLRGAHLLSMPSSNSIGDQAILSQRFQSAPQQLVVLSNLHNRHHMLQQKSFKDRSISWSKVITRGNATAKPEKLGAALCHSQTRARNAEKLASEALIEKDKLAKLFCREANTCRTYEKKIHLLELENLWLKALVEDNSEMGCELPSYFNTSASRHCKFYKRGFSKDCSSVPGTIGLAFALGLSCASAGFVLGCCMGLIGLSH